MIGFLKKIDPLVVACFSLHDIASVFLAKHFIAVRNMLLIVAHLSLIGVFFPEFRRGFGSLAIGMLIGIVFLGPLSRIFRMRLLLQMMGLRREFGILMGYLAVVHGLTYLIDSRWVGTFMVSYGQVGIYGIPLYLALGFLALLLTLPLLITSNNLSMRLLGGKNWKLLHRLVYVAFITSALHWFLIRGTRGTAGYANGVIQASALIFVYALIKLLAWRNFIAPLRDIIAYVSERYRAYTLTKQVETV